MEQFVDREPEIRTLEKEYSKKEALACRCIWTAAGGKDDASLRVYEGEKGIVFSGDTRIGSG